jgi:glyoxylase-like metal-dependent hydrolase (beta-lactamase superfamily II)
LRITELKPGLWRWTGKHPEWAPEHGGPNGWEEEVSCFYYEAPEAVVLIDPLIPPEDPERFLEALDRDVERVGLPVRILVTARWHSRSKDELAARYGASTWVFRRGGEAPDGAQAFDAQAAEEAFLWVEEHGALVSCDVLMGDENGALRLCPESWFDEGWNHARLRETLRPLLDLPVELVLPTHGEPIVDGARDALARALGE